MTIVPGCTVPRADARAVGLIQGLSEHKSLTERSILGEIDRDSMLRSRLPPARDVGWLQPLGRGLRGGLSHAGWLLSNRPQQRRILMLVSDGKPEDRGEYRGKYGIKDTAMAVQEVQRHGVHVHCISLDAAEDADGYLTEIFGKGRYLKLDHVDALPARLPEVFRGLIR